jgi:class 3 adenylate cyclase
MAACANCGRENPSDARFCSGCGTPLRARVDARDERRIVSVIFVDLVGFTARAERLDPEDVRALLTPYHDRVRREIESFGGVVEKFIGDAVMGIFGAPLAHGDDAERAVRAALVIRDSVGAIADGELQIRIAVNTGEAMVSLGARPSLGESMVAGDVVNTAARLQAAAPTNGVVVGEKTYLETRDVIAYEVTDPIVAKGKSRPVEAWLAKHAITEAGERLWHERAIVGREPELALLQAVWERVNAVGLPHLVSVLGPAGVGKSTLIGTFTERARADGARIVRGRSLPYRESGAYGALSTQIMRLCGTFESDPPDVIAERLSARAVDLLGNEETARIVAGHLGAIVGADSGGDAPDRDALFSSVRRFVDGVAREQPTIFVFEDIHWADGNLLDLIELVATRSHGLPLLLVVAARPELLDLRPGWGAGVAGFTSFAVAPLDEADSRELAVRRLGDTAHAEDVVRVAEGNPLFIEQLAATIDETGSGDLPTSIRGIVAARLDALPRQERALLLDAAVVGRLFWNDALRALNPELDDLDGLVDELERRDLVRREPTSLLENQQQFTFTHVLIRDVAYELMPRADRARRHAAVAGFFERSTGSSGEALGALARHWRDAGEFRLAVEQLTKAAEQAERGWAKDHAVLLYREALALVPEDDDEQRSAIRRRLAIASAASFHLPDVRRPESPPA